MLYIWTKVMIVGFLIVLIFFLVFRAVGTANDKSPVDRMGEMISGKPMKKKEQKKKGRAILVKYYAIKYPILDKVRKKCNMEEREKINDAIHIIHEKKKEMQIEEENFIDETDKRMLTGK